MASTFAERLKELRIDKGLTMKQVADAVKVSEMAISHWENNKRIANVQVVIALARFFGVTVGYLVGAED